MGEKGAETGAANKDYSKPSSAATGFAGKQIQVRLTWHHLG